MLIHHLVDLLLGYISLSEILEDLLELLHVHGPVLVSVVALESVLQLYIEKSLIMREIRLSYQ